MDQSTHSKSNGGSQTILAELTTIERSTLLSMIAGEIPLNVVTVENGFSPALVQAAERLEQWQRYGLSKKEKTGDNHNAKLRQVWSSDDAEQVGAGCMGVFGLPRKDQV